MEIIEELVKAVSEDINKIRLGEQDETGIYRYAFSCNPKPYPISGFQHFFGTAFIAARLAEFSGLSDDDQVTNFLIGLIHDYEKMGLDLNRLEGDVYELLGETRLANVVDKYCDRWKDAIEVASKLESGGIPRNLQRMAEFVRLGDYLTGGEESWNIAYVMDMVKSVLDKIFVKHHLVPIVVGKQRPVIAMVAEKLEDEIRGLNLIPLVSMPTGLLVLSKDPIDVKISNRLYEALTEYIINMPSAVAGTASKETKRTRINLDIVKNIIDTSKVLMQTRDEKERDSARKRLSSLLGRVGTLYKLSSADLASAKVVFQSPEDKRRLVIYLVISLARTLYSQANEKTLRAILDELEVKVAEGNIERMLAQLYDNLGDSEERVNELLESLLDKARRCMAGTASGKDVEESIANVLKRTIGIGFMETTPSIDGDSCFRCRERIKRGGARTLYEQLQVEQRATKTAYADVFHPDKQGKPESLSSMNESSKRMIVCPVCFFEAKVFTEVTGFTDGMWASNIIYYPAISVDLLRVFRSVAGHYPVLGIMRGSGRKTLNRSSYRTTSLAG